MKIYKKWFIVDINDKDNPRSLFSFVDEESLPRGKSTFYEIRGIRYNFVSKGKWYYDKMEAQRAKGYEKRLKVKLKALAADKLMLLAEGPRIKEQLDETGYWKYQDIYVEKVQEKSKV